MKCEKIIKKTKDEIKFEKFLKKNKNRIEKNIEMLVEKAVEIRRIRHGNILYTITDNSQDKFLTITYKIKKVKNENNN